jgi:3-oxoacyl-[acyl-carrier protein] reductase
MLLKDQDIEGQGRRNIMDLNLKNRVAFITGAGMGIAKAIALGLVREGVRIAFMEVSEELLKETCGEIESMGGEAKGVLGSVTEVEDVRRAVSSTIDRFGRIDILVNSAGSTPAGNTVDISHDDWAQAFDVKFLGYVRCVKEVLPYMINQGGGKIINLVGIGATEIIPLHVAGAANNAGVTVLTSYLAQEVGKYNVLVSGINPGLVGPTAKLERLFEAISRERRCSVKEVAQEMTGKVPLGRFCQVEDVANLAVFLASDANKYITGAVITIDGGYSKAIMNG